MIKMQTLGDALKGVNEAYGILIPYLKKSNRRDFEMIDYSEPEAFQQKKEILGTDMAQSVLGSTDIREMEEINKVLAENFAFDKPIKRLSLIKERQESGTAYRLHVEFKDGLYISGIGYPDPSCNLEKHYDIYTSIPPKLRFIYEVNPQTIFTRGSMSGFKLRPEQIPPRLFYPNYAEKTIKLAEWGEATIESEAKGVVERKLGERAERVLKKYYEDIQRKLLDDKYRFGIIIDHLPSSEAHPQGVIEGRNYFNPSIEKGRPVLSTGLFQITSRFDEIEDAVRNVYKNLNIGKLDDFESIS